MSDGNETISTTLNEYRATLPDYAGDLFKSDCDNRIEAAVTLIYNVEQTVGVNFWRTADIEDKLYILDLADGINNTGLRHMNVSDISEEMKYLICNNSVNTVVDAWCWITVMSGVLGEGNRREINPTNMNELRACIVTDVQLLKERNGGVLESSVVIGTTNNEKINQMIVAAAQADVSVIVDGNYHAEMPLANTGTSNENKDYYQTNTIVKELTEEQYKFLECGTTSREAMALPSVVPGRANPYQVMALVTQSIEPAENAQINEDDEIIVDVSAEELREVDAIESDKSTDVEEVEGVIRFGNIASSKKYAHYCAQLMAKAIPKRNESLVEDLRRALMREVNGQEAIALYIMLYDEAAKAPYTPGISIFKEMLCKDKMSKRLSGNIAGKFDFLDIFNILTTSSKGWSDFMNLSAIKAFKLDDIYYMMLTEKNKHETVAYVDIWGEKCQAKQDGIFEDMEVQNVYMFSEPVQIRYNVILRYLMYWGGQSGLHKGIIISGSLNAEPNRMYNAVFLNETTGKGFINWKLSEAVFKNITMREGDGFFDKSYEASEAYYNKYGEGMEGYEPLNIEAPSQGSKVYQAGKIFGKAVKNIDYAAEAVYEAPGKVVEAAKRTAENVKTGVTEACRDMAAGYKESTEQ